MSGFVEGWNEITSDIINNLPLTDRDPAIVIPHDSDSSSTTFYLSSIYISEDGNGKKSAGVYIADDDSNAVDVKFNSGIFNRMLSKLSQSNTESDYLRELFIPFDPQVGTTDRLGPDDVESIPRHTVYPETADDGTRILHVSVETPNENDESVELKVSGYDKVTIEPETSFENNVNVEKNIYVGSSDTTQISIEPSAETGYIKSDGGNYLCIQHDTSDIIMDPGISTGHIKLDGNHGHSGGESNTENHMISPIDDMYNSTEYGNKDLALFPRSSGENNPSVRYEIRSNSYIIPRWLKLNPDLSGMSPTLSIIEDDSGNENNNNNCIYTILPFYYPQNATDSDGNYLTESRVLNLYKYYLVRPCRNDDNFEDLIGYVYTSDSSDEIVYVLERVDDYCETMSTGDQFLPKYVFTLSLIHI